MVCTWVKQLACDEGSDDDEWNGINEMGTDYLMMIILIEGTSRQFSSPGGSIFGSNTT